MDAIYKSFEYQFRDQRLFEDYCCLNSIGWEYWQEPNAYYRDSTASIQKQCIFQYTVSGEGILVLEKQPYPIRPGQTFLIERPGPFQYYRPKNASHWEFKFLSLTLSSLSIWKNITQSFGRIVEIPPDSTVMQYWDKLYELSLMDKMDNFFQTSAYAYQFMMHLHDTLYRANDQMENDIIQTCLNLIQNRYKEPLTLQNMAELCNVSPSYLTKNFQEYLKTSPVQYLISHRIEVACSLLLRTRLHIDKIAEQVGFQSANYFARAFRKVMGMSPREFRSNEYTKTVEDRSVSFQVTPEYIESTEK